MDNFEMIELTLDTAGGTVFGMMYLPEETRKGTRVPTVIYAHGAGTHHDSGEAYARELAKRGYAVYCLDFGGVIGSKSAGVPLSMTAFTEQGELEAVYTELTKLPYVDLNNVFLMGASLGGAVAALTAAKINALIKGLILLYPAFSIPGEIQRMWPAQEDIPETFTFHSAEFGKQFLETLYGFDFYSVIADYTGPVLILHGMSDPVVASGYSVRAVNTYKHAKLELIGEVGHGFEGGAFKYAVRKIVGFLDEEADFADESGLEGDLNFSAGSPMGGMFG